MVSQFPKGYFLTTGEISLKAISTISTKMGWYALEEKEHKEKSTDQLSKGTTGKEEGKTFFLKSEVARKTVSEAVKGSIRVNIVIHSRSEVWTISVLLWCLSLDASKFMFYSRANGQSYPTSWYFCHNIPTRLRVIICHISTHHNLKHSLL